MMQAFNVVAVFVSPILKSNGLPFVAFGESSGHLSTDTSLGGSRCNASSQDREKVD
jgi:hypothetical protein